MVAKNDITGNTIVSKPATQSFREGWERIFNQKEDKVLIEKDYDDNFLISVSGNRNLMKLSKKQFDCLIVAVLQQVTAEHVAEALKEVE
jgi:hypothetical protein